MTAPGNEPGLAAAKAAMPRRIVSSLAATLLLIAAVTVPMALFIWMGWRVANGNPVRWVDLLVVLGFLASVFVLMAILQDTGRIKPPFLVPFTVARLLRLVVERSVFGVGPLVGFTAWNNELGLDRLVRPRPLEQFERYEQRLASTGSNDLRSRPAPRTRPGAGSGRRTAPGGLIWPGATVEHVVGRGDTYWSLAERCFGDGARWSEIRDLNVGRVVADGVTMGADDDLRRGWTILLPDIPNKEVV